MTSSTEDRQFRGWAIDYALRLQPKEAICTPEQILKDAAVFSAYIDGRPRVQVLRLARNSRKK